MELQSIIKDILRKNSFVSLPGLGSFTKNYESARLSPDGKQLIPPKHTISFDRSRVFNDEAIEVYLREKQNITVTQAAKAAEEFVKIVKAKLESGLAVDFDGIGTLKKDSAGSIEFSQANDSVLASDSFGLEPITLQNPVDTPVYQNTKSKVNTQSLEVKPKSTLTKRVLLGSAAAVLIVALFASVIFFLFPNSLLLSPSAESAKTDGKPVKQVSDFTPDASHLTADDSSDVVSGKSESKHPDDHVVKSVETKTSKRQALLYQEPKPTDSKTYYIISGSFNSMENARKHYDNLVSKGFKPEIIEGNGNYRVSLVKFNDRNRAITELERLRIQKSTESVWLLGI